MDSEKSGGVKFDASKLSRAHWIVVGGAAVTFIAVLFFSWYSISVGPFTATASAWDTGGIGKLAVLGGIALAAVAVAIVLDVQEQVPFPLSTAALVLALFVVLMVIIKFLQHHSHTSYGLWITLIAALVAAYGAYELGGHNEISARMSNPSGQDS